MSSLIKKILGLSKSPDAYSEDATIKVLDHAIAFGNGEVNSRDDNSRAPENAGV